MRMQRLAYAMFYVALVLAIIVLCNTRTEQQAPRFVVADDLDINLNHPYEESSVLIPEPGYLLASHAATFTLLGNGDLLALWFAGSSEGASDVKIWSSRFANNHWSMAVPVVSPEMLSQNLGFFVKKLGNPVVYRDPHTHILHLLVVSVGGVGGWAVSNLNHLYSYDEGKSWGLPTRLILSPGFNISTLDRTLPVPLQDGGFYVPVYYELLYKYPELLRFDASGALVAQSRINTQHDLLQPALVVLNEHEALAFFRNAGKHNNLLYMQSTNDGGRTWSRPVATNLRNYDSSIAVTKINKALLMVHNVGPGRGKLVISVSDDGITWKTLLVLEDTPHQEFSYPVIIAHQSMVDILYTWKRKAIKHVRILWK